MFSYPMIQVIPLLGIYPTEILKDAKEDLYRKPFMVKCLTVKNQETN